MSTVIKLENISKQYRLGTVGSGTIQGDVAKAWAKMLGKEDPTLKIGQENKLADANGEYVWALKDINLEVKQGEILGVIGKNGAGKSTLLKILSRVTAPTTGSIKVKGRIASLLEVGTGFHPELTGRENVFMNGAILGMRKAEVKSKLDEIVDFAGIAKYLDTPVKRYSSGMYVRLGFAVAAHLEPEILIVDEVLAVGDVEFQKKAIGKMQDVSQNSGRTVLFVSHNMQSIRNLCNNAMMLSRGQIENYGNVEEIVDTYISENSILSSSSGEIVNTIEESPIQFVNVEIENLSSSQDIIPGCNLSVKVFFEVKNRDLPFENAKYSIQILDQKYQQIATISNYDTDLLFEESVIERGYIQCVLKNIPLNHGVFHLGVNVVQSSRTLQKLKKLVQFEVKQQPYLGIVNLNHPVHGSVLIEREWI